LIEHCKKHRIAYLELCNEWLDSSLMRRLGFRASVDVEQVCSLDGGQAAVWARMRGGCRTRIRKAENHGLVATPTEDPGIVDVFYSQFNEVLERKRLTAPYSRTMARALFRHLVPADRLFAIQVKHENKVIATALYPHDERTLYFLDAGYDANYLHLSSNELLHWTAMKLAIARGITKFSINTGQPSRFTEKFGVHEVPYVVYRQSFVPILEAARKVYLFGRRIARAAQTLRPSDERAPTSVAETESPAHHASGNGVSTDRQRRTRWLVVVQPNEPELYQMLRDQMSDAAPVIVDRRRGTPPRDGGVVTAAPPHEDRQRGSPKPLATIYASTSSVTSHRQR
jgi:hypothetical protein